MVRVLRDKTSGLYYKGSGEWTGRKEKAFVFADLAAAMECSQHLQRSFLELVLCFSGPGRDISFPLK